MILASSVFTKFSLKLQPCKAFSHLLIRHCWLLAACYSSALQGASADHGKQVHQHDHYAAARYQLREITNPLSTQSIEEIKLLESNGYELNLKQLLGRYSSSLTEAGADQLNESGSNEPHKTNTKIIQFIFTSCKNICPVMSSIAQAIQDKVKDDTELISISIDPQHDRPEQLREYARLFGALPHWRFFTGELDDIVRLQKRLSVYQQNKMQHQPVTFILHAARLFRIDGLPSRAAMLSELANIRAITRSNAPSAAHH